jgi:hypothetical protein
MFSRQITEIAWHVFAPFGTSPAVALSSDPSGFCRLARAALNDPIQIGQTLFVYPYIYRPILATCNLRPGINHLLALSAGDRFRLAANGLPNCYFIQVPKMYFLFSEADLAASGMAGFGALVGLQLNAAFDPITSNLEIPELNANILNHDVQLTMQHQTATGQWFRFVDLVDQRLNPNRMVYQARAFDRALTVWQEANCQPQN